MTKNELYEKIEALENEIEELEEQLAEIDQYKHLDKAQREVVYLTTGLIKAFKNEGLLTDQAVELTKVVLQAGARS